MAIAYAAKEGSAVFADDVFLQASQIPHRLDSGIVLTDEVNRFKKKVRSPRLISWTAPVVEGPSRSFRPAVSIHLDPRISRDVQYPTGRILLVP